MKGVRMKKKIFVVGGLVIAAGVIGAGAWYYKEYYRGGGSGDGDVVYVSKVSEINGEDFGTQNRYAGVVEAQETVKVNIENGRKVKEVQVSVGDEVKEGQLLFEYDLTSIEEDLKEAQLSLDRLKNEAMSLGEQIATLEKEKKKASKDSQLSYTIEIETNKMNLKKNEYDQQSKEAEIEKLQNATTNTEVRSGIDGIIQKIDTTKMTSDDGDSLEESYYNSYNGSDGNDAFITILSTGAYRVKGKVNEQNRNSIMQGEPVLIRSRVDENQLWRGIMGGIDEQNATSDGGNNMYGMIDSSGDSQTTSSSYPFYVELESSEGLMLGQHVYIEMDVGQEAEKEGLWLSEFYIVGADTEEPYVWAAGEKGRLEKRFVVLGQYDEDLEEYQIQEGLGKDDSIAFPAEDLEEGRPTEYAPAMPIGLEDGDTEEDLGDMGYEDGDPEIIEDWDEFEDPFLDEDTFPDEELEYVDDGEFDMGDDGYFDMEDEGDFYDEIIIEPGETEIYDSDDMEAAG